MLYFMATEYRFIFPCPYCGCKHSWAVSDNGKTAVYCQECGAMHSTGQDVATHKEDSESSSGVSFRGNLGGLKHWSDNKNVARLSMDDGQITGE